MIRDITLGQYYPVQSVIHRLDPRTKLMGTLIHIVVLFVAKDYKGYLLAALFLVLVIALSRVPLGHILKGLKPIFILLVFSVVFNLFFVKGEPLVEFWFITISKEGVRTACYMGVRLVFLIIGSSIVTFTTTPNKLTDGLEKGLGFLRILRIPVHEIAMMMSIALRFIPILVEETDKIMKAQMARGADFESGGLIKRAKSLVPLLVPLFISAFRRATDLAMAMEARCYHGGKGRTKMVPLKYSAGDFIGYAVLAVYLAGMILLRVLW